MWFIEILVFICLGWGAVMAFIKNTATTVKTRLAEEKAKNNPVENKNYQFTLIQRKSILLGILLTMKGNNTLSERDYILLKEVSSVVDFDVSTKLPEIIQLDKKEYENQIRNALGSLKKEQQDWFILMLSFAIKYNEEINLQRCEVMHYILTLMGFTTSTAIEVMNKYNT